MRRISLGGMYHRLRRASLKTRSFMTCFLKRLSKASCDSPSFKVTFVNTLTSFLRQGLTHWAIHMGRRKPGLFTHVPDDNRVCTALAVRCSHTAARTLVHRSQPLYRKGDAHLGAVTATPRALVQSTWRPFSSTEAAATSPAACGLPMAAHPGADDGNIIPDFRAKVKASTRCRCGGGRNPLSEGCQKLGDPISHLLLTTVQEVIGTGE
jgi:hypothetical protein